MHYGHSVDLEHLRISRDDKGIIAAKLIAGVTKTRILDSIRDKIEESLKRLDLLNFKDVDNIKRSCQIETRDGKRHSSDALSLDLWVQECKARAPEENPVIFYKKQGEKSDLLEQNDFCLAVMNKFQQMMLIRFGKNVISIDGTHGLNGYEFELTTLMVIDEFGQGFPAAFMFSNKKDTHIYNIFFKSIRQKIGNICAKTFMSDITETFYTACHQVMGPVTYRLFCSWHVDRAWQMNLTKIKDNEKRGEIYRTLKVLQTELNENEFQRKLVTAIRLMLDDKDTCSFGHYFETNYMNNCEQWAYCHRKSTGINTNMRLESMHKTIKYFYLNRKKIKRLDKGLHIVLKCIRDKSVERVIKLVKGKNTICHREIFKRHQAAKKNTFTFQVIDAMTWEVGGDLNNTYSVNRLLHSPCCHLICSECKICIHMYTCTCEDFNLNFKICKHIHYIKMSELTSTNDNTNLASETLPEESTSFVTLLSNQTKNKNIHSLFNKINETFIKLQNSNLSDLDDVTIVEMHTHLNVLNNIVDLPSASDKIFFPKTEPVNESPNKNIIPQFRLFSTQKKRKHLNNKNKKPSKNK